MTVYRRENPNYITVTTNIPFYSKTFTFGDFPTPDEVSEFKHKELDAYWELTNNEKIVYNTIIQRAYDIWEGKTNSLKMNVPLEDFEFSREHKVSTRPILMKNEISNVNLQKVEMALHKDYEWLVWFEGNMEWYWEDPCLSYTSEGNEGSSFKLRIVPSKKYADENDDLNHESLESLKRSKETINQILTEADGLNENEKLKFFETKVLDLLEYDDEGLKNYKNDIDAYVNSNGILSAFDPENNKVLCGGYSNSFQALCDLAGINNVYTRVGDYKTEKQNDFHAWNFVIKDNGEKYLFDLTNSDTGTIGQNGKLSDRLIEGNEYSIDLGYDLVQYCETDRSYSKIS